jgi:hypothetical protein
MNLLGAMSKIIRFCVLTFIMMALGIFSSIAFSVQLMGTIASKHVMLQMPSERELLGRELSDDIERCYDFMDRSIHKSLPRKIFITVDWNLSESSSNYRTDSIIIGMNQPAVLKDEKGFLFHNIAREIARMGLLYLSQGAQREDTEFLFDGMIEILVHDFNHSSRGLDAAWATAHLLDEMHLLGFAQQRSWSSFSGDKHNHRNASPGITFIASLRDLQDRDRPMKFFESLRTNSLLNGLGVAFKSPSSELEKVWLNKVREYQIPDELTTKAGDAPQLVKMSVTPKAAKPGTSIQINLNIEDASYDLIPENIFVKDDRSGRTYSVQLASDKKDPFFTLSIPIEPACASGSYTFHVVAIDENGNLRRWIGNYSVSSAQ